MSQAIVDLEKNLNEGVLQTTAQARKRVLFIAFTICYISILFGGVSSMLMSVYLPVVVKDLVGNVQSDRVNIIGAYINSIFILGSMIGGFGWGVLCDKIGRVKTVALSTGLYALFTILTSFASSWVMAGVLRFFTGVGIGGILVTTNVLVAELWPEKKRAVALGIVSAAMPVGFIAAGLLNNLMPQWRNAFLTGIIPLLAAAVGYFILSEPGAWKQAVGERRKKKKQETLWPENKKNLVAGSVIFGAMLIGLWAIFSWAPTWVQSLTLDSSKVDALRGSTLMVLSLSGLAGSVVSGWIVNQAGMKKTMIICFVACFVLTGIVFKLNHTITVTTFVEMGVLAFFFGISQGALSVYIPSLFPARVRASATGVCFNVGRLFTASVVFFIGALVSLLGGYGNAVFIFSFIFVIGLAATLFQKDEQQQSQY